MGDLNISPQSLHTSAEGLNDLVDRIVAAIGTLETDVRGQGSPWGNGLIGQVLGQLYSAVHDVMLNEVETNGSIITEYAEGLDFSATTLQQLEVEIENDLLDISGELTGVWTTRPPQ
jgi:hypothetical protein